MIFLPIQGHNENMGIIRFPDSDYSNNVRGLYELGFLHIGDVLVFGGVICLSSWLIQDDHR